MESMPKFIKESLDFLIEYEFIRSQTNGEYNEENFIATRLGLACLASSMPPTDGLILFAELQKSRRCFVLESELHAVYLVTPYSVCSQLQDIDWLVYLDMWEKLKPSMKKVGELVGIKESFLVRAMRGQSKLDYKLMQVHKRFYIALALQELVNETPINQVALKYKCNRGMLQSLQQMASTFAGIVTAFCNSLNWSTLALIVSQFKERLFFGIHQDLIDLMRLPDLNHKRARVLYDAGITNLIELANAESFTVEKILCNALSFDTIKQHDNENIYETEKRNIERNFFLTGKLEITVHEASKLLVENARLFVQYEIGVGSIHWSQSQSNATKETSEHHLDNKEKSLCRNEAEHDNLSKKLLKTKNDQYNRILEMKVLEKADENEDNKNTLLNNPKDNLNDSNNKLDHRTNDDAKEGNLNKKENYAKNQLPSISYNELDSKQVLIKSQQCKQIEGQLQPNKCSKTKDYKTNKDRITKSDNNLEPAPKCAQLLSELAIHITSQDTKAQSNTNRVSPSNLIVCDNSSKQNLNANRKNIESQKQLIKTKIGGKSVVNNRLVPSTKQSENVLPLERMENELKDSNSSIVDKHKIVNTLRTPMCNKTLRLSQRNHVASSTRFVQLPEQSNSSTRNDVDMELFMQEDETFEMNTGIIKALDIADKILIEDFPRYTSPHTNKSNEDEIPSSQKYEEVEEEQMQTPQRSRFLRSYRNQRKESPKVRKVQLVQLAPTPTTITTSSSSIELSDLSTENSLMQNPQQLNASKVLYCSSENSSHFESVDIIDLCENQTLFQSGFKELKAAKRIAISIALKKDTNKRKPLIGSNLLLRSCPNSLKSAPDNDVQFALNDPSNTYLTGVAFAIQENVVYFMNMQDAETGEGVTKELKCEYLRLLLKSSELTVLMHDAKEQLKAILKAIPSLKNICVHLEDPKVANWLLQPDRNLSFSKMAEQFAPNCLKLVKLCGSERDYSSLGLDADSTICAKVRSTVEACVTNHILTAQKENLEKLGSGQFTKFFKELEMPLQLYLCNMELYGFPASESALRQLFQKMIEATKKVEAKIYELHGARFNLDSTSAVARVLGLHRKSNGRVSTSRQILEKIDTPISQLIISYRKLSVTIKKNVQPLLKCVLNNRIHGQSVTFSSTGRISMIEPNLQNVAKDFIIELGATEKITISCRSAFFSSNEKRCLISSDFCQLEMRILAHLSQDAMLLQVINSESDVFTALAARWNKINENEVSEQLRNGTKQICYGIVYGMGMRSLAEALKCTEEEAKSVSEQFHGAYPGIRVYTEKVIKFARHKGYIETITGRRRYLEHINSSELQFRKQAERQAINSTIQGSAADIAKSAISRMENNLKKYREKLGMELTASVQLVLHLHDELIYEAPEDKAKKVAKILRVTMENCVKLNVPLKVKIKIGKSWGSLKEVNL